ncbi:MAG: metallophosphoesterase [Deltaproteobacteria bacterium]|nr:metallophosphoesterase [Deltaproteobacteria bacterium]NIS77355.1 metallophosphoesterase [Deltaproteobacteria bacterium]
MAAKKRNINASDISPRFLGLIGFCCLYIFFKAKGAFSLGPGLSLGLFLPFLAVCLVLPAAVHITLRRGGPSRAARIAFWAGYSWMGFVLLFLFVTTSIDIATLLLGTASALANNVPDIVSTSQMDRFILSLFLSIVLSGYALMEAYFPRVKRVVIETEKLPRSVDRLRIAQISDVHLGPVVGKRRAQRIAAKIADVTPHILVSTGDLIDSRPAYLSGLEGIFKGIQAPLGKFAVVGNHEVSAGLDKSIAFMEEAGFRVLRNETAVAGGIIRIAGADDKAAGKDADGLRYCRGPGENGAGLFTLYLKHRPPPGNTGDGVDFDLQLSGHTHGGQLFPFRYVTLGYYPKLRGLYSLEQGKLLYVTPGAGTWGPPMRFLTPPEITVIELVGARTSTG